jgi:hypothetical protein
MIPSSAARYPAEVYARFLEIMMFIGSFEERNWEALCQSFVESYGILCLSESPDNALMWSHYASDHTGLVFEFDVTHWFFDQSYSSSMPTRHLKQVIYQTHLSLLPHPLPYAENLYAFWLTKTTDWSYEREWRITLSLE